MVCDLLSISLVRQAYIISGTSKGVALRNMKNDIGFASAMKLLPANTALAASGLPEEVRCRINEIRLRIGRPVALTLGGRNEILNGAGTVTKEDIETIISRAFRNSIHSSPEQVCAGYITYENGCRVGFSGTAANECGTVVNVRDINSVCIRIPREVIGCSEEIFAKCLRKRPSSVLLFGQPSSGKTTYLRDLTRMCGNRYRTALIDERSEIAAVFSGTPSNDVGIFTDVFERYPRKAAIETAIRVMSPQVIVCDEIGSSEDTVSLNYAVESGTCLIATCHCGSVKGLFRKPEISELIAGGIFEYAIWLEDHEVREISTVGELICSGR